ncbi:hypothetical protein BW716_31785 [[Flexibacter] sp. ATCC 35208]|nr:hypothetical protein BW716_31785 [[Flexibacter] sp. ATCC 35208]
MHQVIRHVQIQLLVLKDQILYVLIQVPVLLQIQVMGLTFVLIRVLVPDYFIHLKTIKNEKEYFFIY